MVIICTKTTLSNFESPFATAVHKRTTTRLKMGSATYAIAIVGWLVQFLVIYYIAAIVAAIVEGNILPCLRDPYIYRVRQECFDMRNYKLSRIIQTWWQ